MTTELVELRHQAELVELRQRAEIAEARLEEQARLLAERAEVVQVLRMALRQLGAAAPDPTASATVSPTPSMPEMPVATPEMPVATAEETPVVVEPARRRRWWQWS
ncbi:hypothetical protein [Nakamurella flavida]|uniref:hypothetical protein n=1 Tax=Nakamurella flavida TaxID=363630 RepID=UPI0031D998B6